MGGIARGDTGGRGDMGGTAIGDTRGTGDRDGIARGDTGGGPARGCMGGMTNGEWQMTNQ